MIGWLSGEIIDQNQPGKLIFNVNGVGYEIETSLHTFFQLEARTELVNLYIHTVVREDALQLFGFLEKHERHVFRELIKINGVGPKLAMAILSSVTTSELLQAVREQDLIFLTKIPGIGKKTVERLMVEMKSKLQQFGSSEISLPVNSSINAPRREQKEAISALEVLGYKSQEAAKLIYQIDDGQQTCEQLIRQALQKNLVCD